MKKPIERLRIKVQVDKEQLALIDERVSDIRISHTRGMREEPTGMITRRWEPDGFHTIIIEWQDAK